MECSKQHYDTKILSVSVSITGIEQTTAQGNKDTMTTMVVVIVDDGDHHHDHDETLGGGVPNCTRLKGMGARQPNHDLRRMRI